MQSRLTISIFLLASLAAYAAKPCQELKDEIAKKLDDRAIRFYSLEIVPSENVKDEAKVVGTCDGGKKTIMYSRTPATTSKPANASIAPAQSKTSAQH